MRVLITGASGFLGGRLASFLNSAGHDIILGSRTLKSPPPWLPNVKSVQLIWDNFCDLKSICKNVDMVVHAAGVNAIDAVKDPAAALLFNGACTARLVNAACSADVQNFVFLSTAHVYAQPLVGTINENTVPTNLHPYATSNLSGEQVVLSASQQGCINGVVLRISNVFGFPMSRSVNCWMLLVNNLCRQAIEGCKLEMTGNVLAQRDFIPMKEFCKIFKELLLIENKDISGVFNVGAGRTQTLFEMASKIQKRCGQILDFEPVLYFDELLKKQTLSPFIYQSEKLEKLGIKADLESEIEEIDQLLSYCSSKFNPKSL